MKTILTSSLLATLLLLTSCGIHVEQPTVTKLDIKKYAGQWHEIGRLPNTFENNIVAARATYTAQKNGTLSLLNEGIKKDGQRTSIIGNVTQPDSRQPGKLRVRFSTFPTNLFTGDYWILGLSQDYTRALIGSPDQRHLWFLSKREKSTKKNFADFVKTADKLGYPTANVIWNENRIKTATSKKATPPKTKTPSDKPTQASEKK